MSSKTPVVRMNRAATLRAAAKSASRPSSPAPRRVGAEGTKPKPAPLPTYAEQNEEKGEQDANAQETAIVDNAEEEEVEHVPAPAPTKNKTATTRSKHSVRATPSAPTYSGAGSVVPAFSLMDLVTDYEPIIAKPGRSVQVVPSFYRLSAINEAVGSILCPIKAIFKRNPTYNTIYTRTALYYCAVYKILVAREVNSLLDDTERKVLKALRGAYDFDTTPIPGPYVAWFCSIGFHTPADRRLDVICPALPAFEDIKVPNANDLTKVEGSVQLRFPNFPYMLRLCNLVSEGKVLNKIKTTDAATSNPTLTDVEEHFSGRFFVPFPITTEKIDGTYNIFGTDMTAAGTRSGLHTLQKNSALFYRFQDQKDYLSRVHHSISHDKIPVPSMSTARGHTNEVESLLHYFGVDKAPRWIAGIMDALTYESKFFSGSTTLANTRFEVGADALCTVTYDLEATAWDNDWFGSFNVKDEGIMCQTYDDNVQKFDLQFALLNSVHLRFTGGPNAAVGVTDVTKVCIEDLSGGRISAFSGRDLKRQIVHVDPIGHRLLQHIRSEMLLPLESVDF